MTSDFPSIDRLLAAVLRGDPAPWPAAWAGEDAIERVTSRVAYHGLPGLIAEQVPLLADWPESVLAPVREQAIALAMWELRHQALLIGLCAAFAREGITALLLKGSALAYDLYPRPAARVRGDSDLLIAAADLDRARTLLASLGYARYDYGQADDDLALQEIWSRPGDRGTDHHIDLHWQLVNAPALGAVLDFADCAADPLPLPRLSPEALALRRVLALLHACVHRAMHITSPYIVDGVTHYGGDRLIWAKDIDLLARALDADEWSEFAALARARGVAAVCLNGLAMARRTLGTKIPDPVAADLGAARGEPASTYLLKSRQLGRALRDLGAIPGWRRRLAYVRARSLPSPAFIRGKYPTMKDRPLALLYLRRVTDLLRARA